MVESKQTFSTVKMTEDAFGILKCETADVAELNGNVKRRKLIWMNTLMLLVQAWQTTHR